MLLGLAYQAPNCSCASLKQLSISSYNDTQEEQIKTQSAQYQSLSLNQKNIFLPQSRLLAPRKAGKCCLSLRTISLKAWFWWLYEGSTICLRNGRGSCVTQALEGLQSCRTFRSVEERGRKDRGSLLYREASYWSKLWMWFVWFFMWSQYILAIASQDF